MLAGHRQKLRSESRAAPLSTLFGQASRLDRKQNEWRSAEADAESFGLDLAGQLIDRLRIDEKIVYSTVATIIRPTFECSGEILLGDARIYFVGESSRTTQVLFHESLIFFVSVYIFVPISFSLSRRSLFRTG